ncbi:leucine-rich repeat-containing protein ODA7 isoform X2 [Prosopis cineraria]|uniref:leucine-rich repeat-containing protein ODA7 isoform X2 n=1 Tax=Prosopis cineraria TaxID=364024 RepID=UPI00240F0F9A|nr:leucine-rich repeat-containing protein ODA7 isoform X2 [Prosopis cineraria]
MTRLNSERILKEKNTGDPNSISTLHLNHKALSDVSILVDFKNLEKLDLKLNNLTSLEGLRSCVNLKWLSVVENKLESLEGIQGLTKLTVLNAGKNKLKSMDQVRSLVSLRAVILNDNEILSICKLDQMKNLNTLVLSKNPIRKLGDALMKVKSISKLQTIDSSLKSCVELKELRLAHNEIKSLPDELAHNSKLLNLDLGNNVLMRYSDIKVLRFLVNLRNLNLLGNPIAGNDKIARKIKKALPKLQIYNARPVDKLTKNENRDRVDGGDFLADSEGEKDRNTSAFEKKDVKHHQIEGEDDRFETTGRKSSKKRKKTVDVVSKKHVTLLDENMVQNKDRKHKNPAIEGKNAGPIDAVKNDREKKSIKKKLRINDKPQEEGVAFEENITKVDKKQKRSKNRKQSEIDVIDDAEASFVDLFNVNDEDLEHGGQIEVVEKVLKDVNFVGDTVPSVCKRKSSKKRNVEPPSYPISEIGMGGPSTWGDE